MALAIAGVVFSMASIGVIQYSIDASQQAAGTAHSAEREALADRLAETILRTPGVHWYAQVDCSTGVPDAAHLDGDGVERLGLAADRCPGSTPGPAINLSYDKIHDLNLALLEADAFNDHLDYAEARSSLGLDEAGLDFHLRTWPILAEIREVLEKGYQDPNQRVAYIGDYDSLTGNQKISYLVQKACGKTVGATSADVWVDVTNNGTTTTAFEVTFSVPLKDRTIELVAHTGLVLPLQTVQAKVTLPKTSDWRWASAATVSVNVADTARSLGSCDVDFSGHVMTSASTTSIVNVHAEKLEEILHSGSVTPKIYYDAYDGKGNSVSYAGWKLVVKNGILTVATDTNLHNRGWESFTLVLTVPYTVQLQSSLSAVLSTDMLNVLVATMSEFTPVISEPVVVTPAASVLPEISYIDALVSAFDANAYSLPYTSLDVPYAAGGDVFPDLKNALNDDLAGYLVDDQGTSSPNDDVATLDTYTLLVVGSSADHNAMTSAAAKQAIRDWVFAGGYLVVFGSEEQAVSWLEPIFHAAIQSASGGLNTPDPSHPVLSVPNALDYMAFDTQDNAWRYSSNDGEYFTHVIVQGGDDVLALSDSGAFGEGRVLLTAWEPFDLLGTGSPPADCTPGNIQPTCAALQTIHNFFTISYRDLYLDYGPVITASRDVGSVNRVGLVLHPELGPVDVAIQVFVY